MHVYLFHCNWHFFVIEKQEIYMCLDKRVMLMFIIGICACLVSAKTWCITHCEPFSMANKIINGGTLPFSEGACFHRLYIYYLYLEFVHIAHTF